MNKTIDFPKLSAAEIIRPTIYCFSHLRWSFVFQRPQHLLTRASRDYRIVFFEEPSFEDVVRPFMRSNFPNPSIQVVTPILPSGMSDADAIRAQRHLLDQLTTSPHQATRIMWYYTPMALQFTGHIECDVCVYDCMDELSAFHGARPELMQLEKELFKRADIVFTGGQSLYEAKRALHPAIYPFPSSVDVAHFATARSCGSEPDDQRKIPHPRIGYFGVIDERLDIELVRSTAQAMPDVQFIFLGPVVKIEPATLPSANNVHWLGNKSYADLPSYLRHWDAGWMPFALNDATRYISPTKTPEFLAAGLPVASTAIVDVVRTYGVEGLVDIVDAGDVVLTLRSLLAAPKETRYSEVDAYLAKMSWDQTWSGMSSRITLAAAMTNVVPLLRGA